VERVRVLVGFLLLAGLFVQPAVVSAHHEAIFGPRSSLVLSAERFLSFQVFSREVETTDSRIRETTTLVSAGVRLSKGRPLMFTAIVPYSRISEAGRPGRSGIEDIVLGVRYRHDLEGLQEKWDRDGNFVMGIGAFELNNGTIDHRAWTGPLDMMGALLGSVERGRWSGIAYGVMRRNLENAEGDKDGDSVFAGGGLAYTPNEDFQTGRLFSYQMGWSFEHYARDRIGRFSDANTGGDQLLVHPTFVYSPGYDVLLFAMMSAPVWRDFQGEAAPDRYRLGTGIVYAW
jgi:hypothetical protein